MLSEAINCGRYGEGQFGEETSVLCDTGLVNYGHPSKGSFQLFLIGLIVDEKLNGRRGY